MAQKTTDYKVFKFMKGNRDIDKQHVEQLARSMALFPDLLQARPILVNGKREIIDGQHRFSACKSLGIPVWFEVVEDLTAADAIALNRNQKNWTIMDFAKSHANEGNEEYQKFLEIAQEHPLIPPSVLSVYLSGVESQGYTVTFREGKFKINDELSSVTYIEQLEDLIEIVPTIRMSKPARAALRIFKSAVYDHKRMVKKMAQWGDVQFNPYGTSISIQRNMEDIYNFHQTEGGTVRLFT